MKLNIIRNNVKGSALFLGMAMLLCGCQREQLAGSGMTDAVTRFTVSVADMPDDADTPATKASLHNTTGSNDNLNEYLTEFQVSVRTSLLF